LSLRIIEINASVKDLRPIRCSKCIPENHREAAALAQTFTLRASRKAEAGVRKPVAGVPGTLAADHLREAWFRNASIAGRKERSRDWPPFL